MEDPAGVLFDASRVDSLMAVVSRRNVGRPLRVGSLASLRGFGVPANALGDVLEAGNPLRDVLRRPVALWTARVNGVSLWCFLIFSVAW